MVNGNIERCRKQPGDFIPVIARGRCEGKQDCVAICPYGVFEMRKLGAAEKNAMPLFSRFKARVHGDWQAFAVRSQDCHACGLCITACPEHAIELIKSGL